MKIAITWSHGVGKSTTLDMIAETTGMRTIEEVARMMIHQWWQQWTPEFQREVIKRQITAEGETDNFISDRSVYDNLAYSLAISKDLYYELRGYAEGTRYDKVYMIPIQDFWIDNDGVRPIDPDFQAIIQDNIFWILADLNVEYELLKWDQQERLHTILSYIKK